MNEAAPRLAVICDRRQVTEAIRNAASAGGCEVIAELLPDHRLPVIAPSYNPDVWIVDLSDSFDDERVLECVCGELGDSVLFDDHAAMLSDPSRSKRWLSRMLGKVENVVVAEQMTVLDSNSEHIQYQDQTNSEDDGQRWASNVWLLGASLGGPDAIVAFLKELPAGLPIGFVYAQHIEAASTSVLIDVIRRHTPLKVRLLRHGMVLGDGEIGVVPVDDVCRILSMGRISVSPGSWNGHYAPSIDQLMDDIAHNYGSKGGAIVFSGMGEDGARAAPLLKSSGGTLWVQSPDSCISSIMPQAVCDTGVVDKQADPAKLARALVDRYTGMAA